MSSNPCAHCGDETDHKAPEALSECYAGLKGLSGHIPPDYLTDPALGMEMLEGLLEAGAEINILKEEDQEGKPVTVSVWTWTSTQDVIDESFTTEKPQHAILRAAHALALAEWEAAQ